MPIFINSYPNPQAFWFVNWQELTRQQTHFFKQQLKFNFYKDIHSAMDLKDRTQAGMFLLAKNFVWKDSIK